MVCTILRMMKKGSLDWQGEGGVSMMDGDGVVCIISGVQLGSRRCIESTERMHGEETS